MTTDRAKSDPLIALDAAIARLRELKSAPYPERSSDYPVRVEPNPLNCGVLTALPDRAGSDTAYVPKHEQAIAHDAPIMQTHRFSSSQWIDRVERVEPTNVNALGVPDALSAKHIERLERIVSGTGWREQYEERAAIIEFDGGLPRNEAEDRAFAECLASIAAQLFDDDG